MATQYDGVPYPGHPYPQSYPDRLATLGRLFGLTPANVEHCRVLEIGCGDGGNLIPLAYALPGSTFVGFDLAATAVAKGQETIAALGLKNITLRQLDLRDVTRELGEFDYISAHGVYSWVPPELRQRILAICKALLAGNGIAYISYNAYPGGHVRDMMSEMMKFHTRGCPDAGVKIKQARSLTKFIADANPGGGHLGAFLHQELERIEESDDSVLYHDDLSEFRSPFYFHQFIEDAARHGLQFLAEADFHEMQDSIFPPEATARLAQLDGDILLKEQYRDFLKCRRFRQTLLVHREVSIHRTPRADAIPGFHIASKARLASPKLDLAPEVLVEFQAPRGGVAQTDHPLTKAALGHLATMWPAAVSFPDLCAAARKWIGEERGEASAEELGEFSSILLQLYANGIVQCHVHAPEFTMEVSERPVASPLARWQVRDSHIVTALNFASVKLEDTLSRRFLTLLDGTRDRAAIKRDLAQGIRTGVATLPPSEGKTPDPEAVVAMMEERFEGNLEQFARFPLLIG